MPTRQDALQVLCAALAPKQTEIRTRQVFCIKLLLDLPVVLTSNTLNMPAEPPKPCVLFKTTLTEKKTSALISFPVVEHLVLLFLSFSQPPPSGNPTFSVLFGHPCIALKNNETTIGKTA